jgi:hypothetical protein
LQAEDQETVKSGEKTAGDQEIVKSEDNKDEDLDKCGNQSDQVTDEKEL